MVDIAKHVRIFEASPTDEYVEKRTAAINAILAKFKKVSAIDSLIELAAAISEGLYDPDQISSDLAEDIGSAIKSKSSSFVVEGSNIEIAMCGSIALLKYISSSKATAGWLSRADCVALALWSSLTLRKPLHEPKIESLRQELIAASARLINESAESARERSEIPALVHPKVTVPAEESEDQSQMKKEFDQRAAATVDALSTNAALDREELDMLWWILGDWSEISGAKVSEMNETTATVVTGLELAERLRRVPATAHRHLVWRGVSKNKKISFGKLVGHLDKEATGLRESMSTEGIVSQIPGAMPLLNAVTSSEGVDDELWIELSVKDWGTRALIEGALIRISNLKEKTL